MPNDESANTGREKCDIILAGVGRNGASFVHGLDALPDAVAKLYITASPTREIETSPTLLRVRGDGEWKDALRAALAGTHLLVAVAAVTGREETFTPEVTAVAHREGALAVAILVEPLLATSPRRGKTPNRLVKGVIRSADATVLFPARQQYGAALTLREAMGRWTERLSDTLRGLLIAATADDTINMHFADIAAVLSGHCVATVGAGRGQTVEDTLRDAAKRALAPPAELATARSLVAHVIGNGAMSLDDARRVVPLLEHLFPKAEVSCGVSVRPDTGDIRATLIAGQLDTRTEEGRRTLGTDPPFFKQGDPAVYGGENLDIAAFIRHDVVLPGALPRPVPAQRTLFDARTPARD